MAAEDALRHESINPPNRNLDPNHNHNLHPKLPLSGCSLYLRTAILQSHSFSGRFLVRAQNPARRNFSDPHPIFLSSSFPLRPSVRICVHLWLLWLRLCRAAASALRVFSGPGNSAPISIAILWLNSTQLNQINQIKPKKNASRLDPQFGRLR